LIVAARLLLVRVDHRRVAVVTVAAGLLLGAVDLLLQKSLPYPWADLANSSAVWALAAFGLGLWVRSPWWRSAIAAVVLLVLAVPAYYVTATLVQNDDIANAWSTTSLLWMFFGVLAGVVFGTAGAFASATGWRGMVAVALPGAVLFAEALVIVRRDAFGWTAIIELALGVLVILVVARSTRNRLIALAAAVPLALIGFAGFLAGGF
jgi:hypothetical protein